MHINVLALWFVLGYGWAAAGQPEPTQAPAGTSGPRPAAEKDPRADRWERAAPLWTAMWEAGRAKNYATAVRIGRELAGFDECARLRYDLACYLCLNGERDEALDSLGRAIGLSLTVDNIAALMRTDADFASIRDDPRFAELQKRADARPRPVPLVHTDAPPLREIPWRYPGPEDPYLAGMRTEFHLEDAVSGAKSDLERVKAVCHWTHSQFGHDGGNDPAVTDPVSVLRAAKTGKKFRCVEYGNVAAAALNAVGVPARVLEIMSPDVEDRVNGAGHVVAEAYLRDKGRWVYLDPQVDIVAELKGEPLNAAEFQQALARGEPGLEYPAWALGALHYLQARIDQGPVPSVGGALLLVPKGSTPPRVFQRRIPMGYTYSTASVRTFYAPPPAPHAETPEVRTHK